MKRLPYLSSAQRRGLLVFEWILLLCIIGLAVWKAGSPQAPSSRETRPSKSPLKGDSFSSPLRGGWVGSVPLEQPFETFPFDPNTADSTTLLRLGLSPWQVRNIYRYRAKHGRYHKLEDFKRLRGLTNEQWERLNPFIRIAREYQYVEPAPSSVPFPKEGEKELDNLNTSGTDSSKALPQRGSGEGVLQKIRLGQTIDINTADTTQLKMIPGIASKRAARIVAYRNRLGGFVSAEQAMEAVELPDSVLRYMTVTPQPVRKININKLSVQRLMNHPYLNFYQAKAIIEYRRNKGDLHSIEELPRLENFRPADIDRLTPYVEF